MSTLEELEYFCNEENSYGALLLTGGWGSGKTYLVDHDLSKKLQENAILIRISLFGINSTEEIHKKVKKEYVDQLVSEKVDLTEDTLNTVQKVLCSATNIVKGVFGNSSTISINAEDYVSVKKEINNKKVVLVFDDLERCNLEPVVLLGCINEYSENKEIKTIVIANEEEMNDKVYGGSNNSNDDQEIYRLQQVTINENELGYENIKEKLFIRTVKQIPELSEIVPELIDEYKTENDIEYQKFLSDNQDCLLDVLSSNSYTNIRSIRFVILNFEREYKKLIEKGIKDNLKEYFVTFTAFSLALRDGKLQKSERYGSLLNDQEIEQEYPGYYINKYMLPSVARWMFGGEWNESDVEHDIDKVIKLEKGLRPIDRIKMFPLVELEEDDIKETLPEMLKEAYSGQLTLEEFNMLFYDFCQAREIKYDWPVEVDMDKLDEGVDKILRGLSSREDENNNIKNMKLISDDDLKHLTPEEHNIYDKIVYFVKNHTEPSMIYKTKLLDALKSKEVSQLRECENICCHDYDDNIVNLILNFYKSITNENKNGFLNIFDHIWEEPVDADSANGLMKLRENLYLLRQQEITEDKTIKAFYTDKFIQIVDQKDQNTKS